MTLHTYHNVVQNTDEWYDLRRGMLTASTIGQLITPAKLQVANNPDSRALIAALAAERITGWSEDNYVNWDMQRGRDDEPRARDFYSQHRAPVVECGYMIREFDDFKLGYSPDGLVGDDGLIEVKSRVPKRQVPVVLSGGVPAEHMGQIQAGLLVSGRDWCDYISWAGGMAFWPVRVEPIDEWVEAITEAATAAEKAIAQMVTDYMAAVDGLPMTERAVLEVVI